ncbi:ribonuclease 3-like [Hevea brasiliensis]|uniref:ribonuclease 3-like n=1 Tax=Hevea brasiliensis TaxID=3981 RepID=UPI0025DC7DDC|nr:ribonuclease 3-like [Hevea brasiliensis]
MAISLLCNSLQINSIDFRPKKQYAKESANTSLPRGNGVAFWLHEWDKHGTCFESVLDQHGYFKAALDLKKQVNLLQALKNAGTGDQSQQPQQQHQ